MPLTLSILSEEDAPAFAVVDDAAMADWPYAQAMGLGLPGPRQQMVEDWVRQGIQSDSTQTYLKVLDDETGQMVAGALWRFQPEDIEKSRMGGNMREQDEAAKMAAAFSAARTEMWEAFRGEFFPDQPYASMIDLPLVRNLPTFAYHVLPDLQILVTLPEYRRRGAGSQLIEWGTKRADERGLKCVLMASPSGLGVYLKHGFKIVREVEMDLRPYGVDATETRRWMLREPKKT